MLGLELHYLQYTFKIKNEFHSLTVLFTRHFYSKGIEVEWLLDKKEMNLLFKFTSPVWSCYYKKHERKNNLEEWKW